MSAADDDDYPEHRTEPCYDAVRDLATHGFDALYDAAKRAFEMDEMWAAITLRAVEKQAANYVSWLGAALVEEGMINAPTVLYAEQDDGDCLFWPADKFAAWYFPKDVLIAGIELMYKRVRAKDRRDARRAAANNPYGAIQ